MKDKTILVIDDDISLCQSLRLGFTHAGAQVITANNGKSGVQQLFKHKPDLVLLDVRMPEMSGWETCRQIRMMSNVPILMLTSLNKDSEVVRGLESGADDFLSKPFNRDILFARTRALLRRSTVDLPTSERPNDNQYDDGYLSINFPMRRITIEGKPVKLSGTEFNLLAFLFQHSGQIMTYHAILVGVWGWEYQDSVEYVHVYMSHLRRKIEVNSRKPVYLLNEHGVGYTFCKAAV